MLLMVMEGVIGYQINSTALNKTYSNGTVFEGFNVSTGWNCNTGTCVLNATIKHEGNASYYLNATSGNTYMTKTTYNINLNQSFPISIQFYLDEDNMTIFHQTQNITTITIYLSNDAVFANYSSDAIVSSTNYLHQGWNKLVLLKSDFSNFGSFSWDSNITTMRVRIDTAGYGGMFVDDMRLNYNSTAIVMLRFDDCWNSTITDVKPILDKYGFKATIFCITNRTGVLYGDGTGYMTLTNITTLKNAGWTVGSHTQNHVYLNSTTPDSTVLSEVNGSYQYLLTNNLSSSTYSFFAYPYGQYTANVTGYTRMFYNLSFSIDYNKYYAQWESDQDSQQFPTYVMHNTTTFVNFNDTLNSAISRGTPFIPLYHMVLNQSGDDSHYNSSIFDQEMQALNQSVNAMNVKVVTAEEYYSEKIMPSVVFTNKNNSLIYFDDGHGTICNGNCSLGHGLFNYYRVIDNFNLTEGVSNPESPIYLSSSTNNEKHIANNLTDTINNLTVSVTTDCSRITSVSYKSNSGITYTPTYTCVGTTLTTTLNTIEYAQNSNILYINYATQPASGGGGGGNVCPAGSFATYVSGTTYVCSCDAGYTFTDNHCVQNPIINTTTPQPQVSVSTPLQAILSQIINKITTPENDSNIICPANKYLVGKECVNNATSTASSSAEIQYETPTKFNLYDWAISLGRVQFILFITLVLILTIGAVYLIIKGFIYLIDNMIPTTKRKV